MATACRATIYAAVGNKCIAGGVLAKGSNVRIVAIRLLKLSGCSRLVAVGHGCLANSHNRSKMNTDTNWKNVVTGLTYLRRPP